MLNSDKKFLNDHLVEVKDKIITKKNEEKYNKILEAEWERIRHLKEALVKYYPFAAY